MKWLLILFGIFANAGASVLVKVASHRIAPGASPVQMALNPVLIAAVGSYGLAFVLYSLALTKLPLNVAHPVMTAGAIVVVGLASVFAFKEPMPPLTALGYALLLAGILSLALGMRSA